MIKKNEHFFFKVFVFFMYELTIIACNFVRFFKT